MGKAPPQHGASGEIKQGRMKRLIEIDVNGKGFHGLMPDIFRQENPSSPENRVWYEGRLRWKAVPRPASRRFLPARRASRSHQGFALVDGHPG
jgi:hypothetical protein